MSPAATTILTIVDLSLKTFGLVRDGKIKRNEKTDQALSALYVAVTETEIYINGINQGQQENRETEQELVRLWRKASIALRSIAPDLAERCFHKGSYWLNPSEWTREDIDNANIGIRQVAKEARDLLAK